MTTNSTPAVPIDYLILGSLAILSVAGCTRESALTPSSVPKTTLVASSASWPNEPPGFALLTDEQFDALNENGWQGAQRDVTNGSGLFVVQDATAPVSPPNVLQFKYAIGFPGGVEPGVEYFDPTAPVRETYFAFWWKPSDPWQNHTSSGVNKLAFLFPQTSGAGDIYIMMFNDGTDSTIQVEPEFPSVTRRLPPNVTATPVTLGNWHRIEWYVKYSTTGSSRDGVINWWLDGALQGSYSDLQTPADGGFIEYQLAPTWGGIGETKSETDFFWYDHAHISEAP